MNKVGVRKGGLVLKGNLEQNEDERKRKMSGGLHFRKWLSKWYHQGIGLE